MTDYGHPLEFGFFPSPDASNVANLMRLVELAEARGIELLTIQDHPYQKRFLDTWTLLSVIGARTERIRLSPNVACLPLRPPVMLAKSSASLDVLTDGRVELALGAGAFWDAIVAAGGPRRTPGEAVGALTEAIDIIRQFWSGGTLRFDGEYYSAHGLHAGPVPAHRIPIWLGALGPKMLRLTGSTADAWIPSLGPVPPEKVPEMAARIDDAALAAGREPSDIRRIYNINGEFGAGSGLLQGSPAQWAQQLAEITTTLGFGTYILATDDADDLARFADEVVPATRELVSAARNVSPSAS